MALYLVKLAAAGTAAAHYIVADRYEIDDTGALRFWLGEDLPLAVFPAGGWIGLQNMVHIRLGDVADEE
jgi:hypothetical protein